MLKVIIVFALLTLIAGGVDFGWVTSDSRALGRLGFWACGAITVALIVRAVLERRRA